MSSDLHHIRYITADGSIIARVCLRKGMPQEEAIANAKLMATADKMLQALEEVSTMLAQHPDFKVGNSKADRETQMGLFNMIGNVSDSGIVELF